MALSRDVVIRLLGDASSAEKAIKSAADAAEVSVSAYRRAEREQAKQAKAAEVAASKQAEAMKSVGQAAMASGAVIAAGLALAAAAAISWETAWAGVEKTVDGSPEQMNALEASLRKLATTLPATHEEIAGVAEAAGQLGIARGDIVEFTEVAIAMGVSTNLSAEEAATGMARLSNIMGTSSKDVDRLGSTLVALGNAGASTEGEILDMSLRIAAAGRQAGFSEGEVMGLANAMSSLGIEAEAGGTAISLVIKKIQSAVLDGGESLEGFASVAGVSSQQFAKAWRDDAASALVTVVQGLGRMQAQGQNVNTVIDDLGLGGIRTSDTLLRLAGNSDGLSDSLALGNKAWAENSALMNEANKRYETTASQIQIAQNAISDAAIEIGSMLLPAIAKGAELVADFARGFSELPDWMKASVVVIGTLAATVGILGGAIMIATPIVAAFRLRMLDLATAAGTSGAMVGMSRFALFMTGPFGAALGVATLALGGLIMWLGSSSRASEEATDYQRELADALRESGGAIDDNVRALAAKRAEETKSDGRTLLQWAKDLGVELPRVTDALLGNKDAHGEFMAAIEAEIALLDVQQSKLGQGSGAEAQRIQNRRDQLNDLRGTFTDLSGSMGAAVAENERLAAAEGETGKAGLTTAGSMDQLATATGDVATLSADAASAAEDLAKALDELNGPTLDMRDATRNYQQQLDEIAEAMGAEGWTKTLDENTEAGRENAEMLDGLATRAMEQANAVMNTTGSYDAFRNSLENSRDALIQTAIDMGMTEADAKALADQILAIPDAASVDIELPTYGQVTQQLKDVYNRIRDIPPQTWTNVGVISGPAIAALESVGFKTRTLPDGTVEVYADTGPARAELARLTGARYAMNVVANLIGVNNNALGGAIGRAAGGSVAGPGGPTDDLIPALGPNGTRYRLSDGEHILDAQDVKLMGGQAGVYAFREALNAGRLATGGGVGIPVGAAVSRAAGGAVFDYAWLATLINSGGRSPVVSVGEWNSYDGTTPHENAEALAFLARTRG